MTPVELSVPFQPVTEFILTLKDLDSGELPRAKTVLGTFGGHAAFTWDPIDGLSDSRYLSNAHRAYMAHKCALAYGGEWKPELVEG